MSLFGFYKEAYFAITDFRSYRLIFRQPLGKSLIYLLYLCAHSSLFGTVALGWHQLPAILDLLGWAEKNFPTMEIRGGTLTSISGGQEPQIKEYLGRRVLTFAFDPANQLEPSQVAQPSVIFKKDRIVLRVQDETQTWTWGMFADSATIDSRALRQAREFLSWAFYPITYSLLLIVYLCFKTLQAALFSVFSLLAGARLGIRLPFHQRFTICLYALTPAITIDALVILTGQETPLMVAGQPVPIFTLIYLVTAAIFTYQATLRCLTLE